MEHHYLMTEPMEEVIEFNRVNGKELPHMIDFAGEIYARQEGQSILLGTYEQNNRPWSPKETPWDFVFQLLPHDLERIAPELERGFAHFPAVGRAGIKKFVNGPFTFSPDGNPLVGPIKGMPGMWSACAVMAGLSQGGGVGLSLANWMVHGDPGADIWAMDVARYGDFATLEYTNSKVRENYSRRFRITFPNEELPAARPLHTTPIYDRLLAHNAVMGAGFGLEHPLWFQDKGKEPIEDVTFYRSNAFKNVGEESRAVRERVGFSEASNFAKYKVSGAGSASWLQGLFTNSLPKIGRTVLTAMLNPEGKIVGEFSISRIGQEEFFLFGSQAAEVHHPRWFLAHLPKGSQIRFETLSLSMVGLTVAGPRSRDVLQKLTSTSLATKDFPFMSFRRVNIGNAAVWLSRMTYTGDLGYEIWIAPEYQRYLFDLIWDAGKEFDMRLFGFRALITMRLEKNFGTWFREYRPIYTPLEAGMERAMKFDHEFIGRAAVEAEMKTGPARKLVMFTVDVDKDRPADVIGDEPVFHGGKVVGWITSGGYAHYSGVSLALGYIPAELAKPGTTGFEIEIIGKMRPASLQLDPVLDPSGSRMRA
jgi:dimethylglycine dehydrogenase